MAVLAGMAFLTSSVAVFTVGASDADAAAKPAGPEATVCSIDGSGNSGATLDLSPVQTANARTIITVGAGLKVPQRGHIVAVATAMQESTLRADLDESESDRDSAGLFQQRRPWGPLADRMDPVKSSRMFYTGGQGGQRGLLDIPSWQSKPIAVAAQAVQVSAFPDAYAKWEPLARELVSGANLVCEDAGTAVGSGQWAAPLKKGSYRITSDFGPRTCAGPCSKFHKGVDLGAPEGTPIYAAAAGKVIFSGTMGTYGNMVELEHSGGVTTRYAHQSRRASTVGQAVKAGQLIGYVGNTGRSYGAHLHFETRLNATPVNPVPFLRSKGVTL
ncbi:MAG: M23 family metallopeptidase [Phycicoccus sp.]